ncbi:hypothetical protein EN794_027305 [Mesorhizobium sp. M00.F.Ca.ET.151.01.1.1]|nr:hypothetical protein EN794_027305 [Mesorhizobium sp. M00.F.Ca.ET.151.01.1.1]
MIFSGSTSAVATCSPACTSPSSPHIQTGGLPSGAQDIVQDIVALLDLAMPGWKVPSRRAAFYSTGGDGEAVKSDPDARGGPPGMTDG